MESFLAALSPSVREELQRALDATPDGEARLRAHVADYIDARGDWPTEPYTADYLARGFIHNASTYYWGGLNPRYGSAGVASTTAAALSGAAVNLAVGQGAIILGNVLVTTYGYQSLSYAMGLQPHAVGTFIGIYNRIAAVTDWRRLGFAAVEPNAFSIYLDSVLGKTLEKEIRRNMTGLFANFAWRGARSALPHTDAKTVGDRPQEVPWVENYVSRFVNYQVENTSLVAKQVAAQGLERGEPPERIAARLKRAFGLSPRYAQAVDNYEMGLMEQKVPRGRVNTLVNRYVERLRRSRAEAVTKTEAMSLYNLGRERKWQEAVLKGEMPVDTVKMWVTAQDELVCKVCRPMDGQTVALGESFYTRDGNVIVPAVHPNCRCLIIPVRNVADFGGTEFVFPVTEKVSKHMGGRSGEDPHPSGSPQSVHRGWDKALVELKPGAYDMPMDMLRGYIRGSGIRIGQKNRIKGLANSILANGFTKPITVWVYEDGPFIRDGMHRLEAAHMLGLPRIPVAIKHVEGNRPKSDLRGTYHGWRIRRQGQLPRRDTPFKDVKAEDGFVRWFNERMAERGEQIAENPSAPPKRKRRSIREVLSKGDGPVLYEAFEEELV